MKKSLLFACVSMTLLTSCSNPITQVSANNNAVNWRTNYYPVEKLFEPKVYCYTDAAGAFNQYTLIQTTLEGKDTIVSYEWYDSSFSPKIRERETISKSGYNTQQYTIIERGEEIPLQVKSGFVAWRQVPNSDTDNIKNVFSASINGITVDLHINGRIQKMDDKRLSNGYLPDASIQIINVGETVVGGSNIKAQQIVETDTVCFSAGVGRVSSVGEKSHFLKKIITYNEFQQLKGSH